MNPKRHSGHPQLSGEHPFGDTGQVILIFLFLGIWTTDSFVWHYSDFLMQVVPDYIRIPLASITIIPGWYLARNGIKMVFGTKRPEPEVITEGVFRFVRHPIYAGAILFYLGVSFTTLSMASTVFCTLVILFYRYISVYEEKILTEQFGDGYLNYKNKVGMLFPRFNRSRP